MMFGSSLAPGVCRRARDLFYDNGVFSEYSDYKVVSVVSVIFNVRLMVTPLVSSNFSSQGVLINRTFLTK
jgi:hypothetical protein